jgi:hypothetical protein
MISSWVTLSAPCRNGRADAVRSGIAAADHHDMLAVGEDRLVGPDWLAGHAPILLRQEVHREVHAREVAAGNRQVARRLGAAGKRDGVILRVDKVRSAHRYADMGVVVEDDAFGRHLLDAPVDMALFHLEIGNAVAQQAARLGVLLIDVDVMAGARELLSAGETCRTRPDDGDLLAGFALGRFGLDPALGESAVDDRAFDGLDGHRRVLNVEGAGRFAWRRANPAGDLRKVVGREQIARRLPPIAAIGEIVPVRDLVVDRTADVAIGDAAVHAARGLVAGRLLA